MRRVLHIVDTPGTGGAETVFLELATRLDPASYTSFAAAPGPGWVWDQLRARGMEPIPVHSTRAFDVPFLAQLWRIIRRHRIDVVQTHLLTTAVYCSLVGLARRVPVVATFHGLGDIDPADRLAGLKCRIINAGAARVVFVSESLRERLLSRTPLERRMTAVIYNGIDAAIFHPARERALREEFGVRDDEVLVGSVGNIAANKGHDTLLSAAAILRERGKPCKFVIVGDGSGGGDAAGRVFAALQRQRDELRLGDDLFFAGFRDGVHRVFNNLDIHVLTSHAEGFSLSTIEAMACGVPVIATRSGGPEEIVTHGETGLLVDVDAPEQVADAIERLLPDRGSRAGLIDRALASVQSRFTCEAMVRSYERLYASL